jgi:acyl-coenzyme A synthetase/AMP-(fatty) acid ligase
MNLVEPILRQARLQPEAEALVDANRVITYAALADLILRTAMHLRRLGICPNDYVGLLLRNDWNHVVAFLAIARLGAIAVQIDSRSRSEERTRIASLFPLKFVLVLPDQELTGTYSIALDHEWCNAVSAADPASDYPADWSAPCAALATSGTTGVPKFTLATHLQSYMHCAAYLEVVPSMRRQRFLLTLPLNFSAGRVACLAHLLRGDTVVLGPVMFTAREYIMWVMRYNITAGFIVPTLVRQLLAAAGSDALLFPDMDVLTSVGAPLFSEEKIGSLRKLTSKFHEMYGAAAMGPIAALRPEEILMHPTSVGKPFSFVDVEVVDDSDKPLGPGTIGQLRCRGPGLSLPTDGLSESTKDFRQGWYYPGELATLNSSGHIHLKGRTSEVIFRGGAKIFAGEVEATLQAHGKVVEAAVIPRRVSGNEEELIAYVLARTTVTSGELLGYCRARLTAYKVPHRIYICSELPRNSAGKVDKQELSLRDAKG